MSMYTTRFQSKLHDTSGSSIIIALVFFLICAIIGSVVVTAASVEAKSIATQRDMKQAELTVGSAAQVLGEDLSSVEIVVVGTDEKSYAPKDQNGKIAKSFWSKYGAEIYANVANRKDTTDIKTLTVSLNSLFEQYNVSAVNAKVNVGSDLSLTVDLSLPSANGAASPYSMRMLIQSVPTYDAKGNLISATYEQPVIQKQSEAA